MWGFILNCVLPAIVIYVSLELAYRYGYVKGKRVGKFKWRCPECRSLLIADSPQEILHGSVDHMKGHLDGATPSPEEGSQ